ncbi:hypothetical protein LTR37_000747 [Vermiconidia calcicola]|uniref:Uncharacterized protein n=1 Tax=Vermiconidia calcicola TaxID=1690605 RepID=A0ACC3NYG1_9PEZI|nr:hypothetical protein LTR37_000747 [Vermiconidia calcicola]
MHFPRRRPYLPSPPSSQQTSQSGSPTPDGGMDSSASLTDKEGGPPPAKRRRISSKERTTEYLDLRGRGEVELEAEQQEELERLLHVLHKRRKIVVIAGAGISVSAGIPDFRSSQGLFRSLKEEHKLKGSGKHLFDASVYKDDTSTSSFHDMVSSMSRLTKDAKPTAFHHMLATIAKEDRLLRLYSQNVDGIDTSLEPLKTCAPLCKDEDGKWPRTIQLHGGLDKMVCSKCHELSDFDADLFSGPTPPLCPRCEEINDIRTNHEGKRSHGIGRLRPRMVLYNEHNPDDVAIGTVTREDLRKRPDAVIVAGTTLKVPGVRRIVREMCGVVRDRRGGVAVWINNDLPPVSKDLEDCFDIVVQGPCDDVASRTAMRKWDEPMEEDNYAEVTEEEAKELHALTVEIPVAQLECGLQHASPEPLPSKRHYNNSFLPPSPLATPKKALLSPEDWSPISSRRTSAVLPSIETETETDGDTIAVKSSSGLLTPTKSQKSSSPAKSIPSLVLKLKDPGKVKGLVGKPAKGTQKKRKQKNVKYVKPAATTSKAKNTTSKTGQTGPKPNMLTNSFKSSKSATAVAEKTGKKPGAALPSPSKKVATSSPSKLRQVSNAYSTEPMQTLPPKDPRNNTSPSKKMSQNNSSPSKKIPSFPNLQAENVGAAKKLKRPFGMV